MTPTAYFVRHGQTQWNAEKRLQGQADTDLDALGLTQARRNGRRLRELVSRPADFDFVASPMRRTRKTMELARTEMGLAPQGYRTDARLMELNFGDWQGFTYAQVEAREPGATVARNADKWRFVPPGKGAESYRMLFERVRPFLDALPERMVCVTHGGVLRVLFHHLAGVAPEVAADMDIPQDRVLRLRDGALDWL